MNTPREDLLGVMLIWIMVKTRWHRRDAPRPWIENIVTSFVAPRKRWRCSTTTARQQQILSLRRSSLLYYEAGVIWDFLLSSSRSPSRSWAAPKSSSLCPFKFLGLVQESWASAVTLEDRLEWDDLVKLADRLVRVVARLRQSRERALSHDRKHCSSTACHWQLSSRWMLLVAHSKQGTVDSVSKQDVAIFIIFSLSASISA